MEVVLESSGTGNASLCIPPPISLTHLIFRLLGIAGTLVGETEEGGKCGGGPAEGGRPGDAVKAA